jgi:hypothetical protein
MVLFSTNFQVLSFGGSLVIVIKKQTNLIRSDVVFFSAYFNNIHDHSVTNFFLNGATFVPTSEVRTATMLMLLVVRN